MIELTAKQAADAIKRGDLDAGEYFDFYRQRAENDAFNSFIWVAGETPERNGGPLAGVPIAIKDLFCTEGIPSQAGSKILEDYRPPYTATSVRNLYAAGGTLLGKTNQDEFAMGSSTENSAYGPTLNPWDTTRVPGGSSGGSASSVAAGNAPWSIGTDTGGSIRQPAALCGIVGMKPTYGAVSRYGMIAFASSLDQAGPFTRDVTDCALLLSAMVGKDPCDSTSIGLPEPIALPTATDLKGIRLGVPEELTGEGIEPGVLAAFEDTLDKARALGATVEPTHLPHSPHGLAAYYLIAPAECSSNLARYDGVRYGLRVEAPGGLLGMYTATREAGFGAEVKRRVLIGTYALSSGYYDAYYGRAQKVRTLIARDFTTAWEQFDFIVTPTTPGVAFELGAKTADPLAMYMNDVCTVPMSLAGIPAISIPNGLSDGLPTGFQIAGPAFSENRILNAAHALEKAIGFDGTGAFA
jgi:aspartyl-tRNA(Asn)/glutamyl-tRNA(Gln) amidotransferase subunit A